MYRSRILNALHSLEGDGLKPSAQRVRARLIDLYGDPLPIDTIRRLALAMPSHVSIKIDGDAKDSFSVVLATQDVPAAWHRPEDDSSLTDELPETFWNRFNQTISDLGDSLPKSPGAFSLAVSLRDRETWLQEYSMSQVHTAITIAMQKDILGSRRVKDAKSIVPFEQSDKYARQQRILACQALHIQRSIMPADCWKPIFSPSGDQENCVVSIDELTRLLRRHFRHKNKRGKKCIALQCLQVDFRDKFHRFLSPEIFGYDKFSKLFKDPRLSSMFSVECRDCGDYLVKVQP